MRLITLTILALLPLLAGCNATPKTAEDRAILADEVDLTIARFNRRDPGMRVFFERAYGYAIFPNVGKGALIVGAASGRGSVFEEGDFIGYCRMTQGTVGAQIGGQAYSQVIFFQTKDALNRFIYDEFTFAAQASAIVVASGASADAKYEEDVCVFTMPKGGAMVEASIGGQKFQFERAQ